MERCFLHKETSLCFIPDIVLLCIFGNSFYKLSPPLPTTPPLPPSLPSPSPPPTVFGINLQRQAGVAGGSLQPVIEANKAESR